MIYSNKILSTVKAESPILYWVVMIHIILAVGCLIGVFIDERTLMGVNVWIKPLKFSISVGIYIFTVGYLMTLYPYSKRKKNCINNIVTWTLLIEVFLIIYQASRGVQSHYNVSSQFDALLFAAMGLLTVINVLIMVLFIFDTIRLKLKTSKSIQWAILLGWLIVLFGSWVGGQMISEMSHNVGVSGDLRIAHFFGLHSIQIIPLFALWISNKWNTTSRNQAITVTFFGLFYATWIGFTFYQAKQGIPLISL
ncbi:hypothetical protein ATE84_3539 [Aquimarina sp. MAR_2010_214]|uniref:hypothetical protein n=1 Tax=Aquimarina sp. MAR_2010_214 TaxID=1250026 RepID=UPI000C700349|nr:hypothetical protein [Aquimarina sp. MAR_2010_214]PKV51454.1 hypothetical protein ATE84_3539 [Aquimarina sp. MAR_2010_214]